MTSKRAFTLIELLVVMSIIMVLASLLLVGVQAAMNAFRRAKAQNEISSVLIAVTQYENDFGVVPPSGIDTGDTGKLGNPTSGIIDHARAWPAAATWSSNNHPIVDCLICPAGKNNDFTPGFFWTDNKNRKYPAPYPKGLTKSITDSAGSYTYLVDPYGNPYRYLTDGRRTDRGLARVNKQEPIMWSAGQDGIEDPDNDQMDNDGDGRVDDPKELHDDICSWNH